MTLLPSNPALRRLIAAMALAVSAWLVICLLMYVQQRRLVYLPQYTRVEAAKTDYVLAREGGIVLRGWRVEGGGRRALLYFGGNAEPLQGLRARFAATLPDHDIYLVAYRGYGASDGEPTQAALFADALALYDQVRAEAPARPIDVMGRSLGSGVASYLAGQRPVDRLVLVTPFDSMAEVAATHYPWLPVRWLLRESYDSARHLARRRGNTLLIRAGADTVIPPAHADRLAAALPVAPQVLDLPGSGHDFDLFAGPLATWRAFVHGSSGDDAEITAPH